MEPYGCLRGRGRDGRRKRQFRATGRQPVIGIAGGLLGIGVAALGLIGVRHMYENYEALTRLDVTMSLFALLIAIASGVLAGLYPTWRVCRVQPASYLKTQ